MCTCTHIVLHITHIASTAEQFFRSLQYDPGTPPWGHLWDVVLHAEWHHQCIHECSTVGCQWNRQGDWNLCVCTRACTRLCVCVNKWMKYLNIDFWFLQFQPELLTSNIINCQRFNYSAVVFFRAHHTTLGVQGYLSTIIREASC